MKRNRLLLLGLLAVVPLVGCTADRTWSTNIADGNHPPIGKCRMGVWHDVTNKPSTSPRASVTYGISFDCRDNDGHPFAVRATGYGQLNNDPVIGFGSGQFWSPSTITGHANGLIWYTRQEFHGTLTLVTGWGGAWANPPSGCTSDKYGEILTCPFDVTFTAQPSS